MTRGLTSAEFDQLFQRFADSPTATSVVRWEALQSYDIPHDEPSLVAFREGTPRPERSVRTSPWLERIATSTAAGKDWSRVRYLDEPHTEYVRWELLAYVESQAAGERILIIPSGPRYEGADFWAFTGAAPSDRYAIVMHYDDAGSPIEFEYVDDPARVSEMLAVAGDLQDDAVSLNTYLSPRREVTGAV